ncbi:MAG: dihydrofolate reductase [Alphaproteobacteria bacterium]|nr:dihydrofolate reductase [Alphaproteobacteria bacterium]
MDSKPPQPSPPSAPPPPPLSLIVAMAHNRVIGRGNDLPWYLPEDLKFFKSMTKNKPVIMGRKTFESIVARLGHPLPHRPHYVISKSCDPTGRGSYEGVSWYQTLESAIGQAKSDHPDLELMIIGGASIYDQAIKLVDRMYITMIDQDVEGDAYFPDFAVADWNQTLVNQHNSAEWSYKTWIFDSTAKNHIEKRSVLA